MRFHCISHRAYVHNILNIDRRILMVHHFGTTVANFGAGDYYLLLSQEEEKN